MTQKIFICDTCGERLQEEQVTMDHDPRTWHNSIMREACDRIDKDEGREKPADRPYHQRHAYTYRGGSSHMYLCGPLHEETHQEYFVHWIGGSMNSSRR